MNLVDRTRWQLIAEPSSGQASIHLAAHLLATSPASPYFGVLRWAEILAPTDGRLREVAFFGMLKRPAAHSSVVAREMRRCLVVNPAHYKVHFMGAMLHRQIDRIPPAVRLMEHAVAIAPDQRPAQEHLWKLRTQWGWNAKGSVGAFHVANGDKDNDKRFFRTENVLFFPKRMDEFDDIDTVLRRDIFFNYLPAEPVIAADAPIVAMGSCFAQHIRQSLLQRGRLSEHVQIPEGLNNTFAIRQFVDWVAGNDELVYSYEKTADGGMERWDIDKDRQPFRTAIAKAGGFIVTIGVAEVWRDKLTRGVYWRGVPADYFDPERHEFFVSTVEENADNLKAVASGLRQIAGDVPVVFTLSPVPLVATMQTDTSIFAADAVSKSTLRVAIDQVVRSNCPGVRYWPSFEAFRWLGGHLERRLYDGERNPRHPSPDIIGRVIDLFVDSYMQKQPDAGRPQ